MKKYELVAEVAKKSGHTQTEVTKVIETFCEVVVNACLENGDEVNLPSMGKFKRKVNKARKGINPLTKTPLDVPESHTLKFTPSSSIKKVITSSSKVKKAKK